MNTVTLSNEKNRLTAQHIASLSDKEVRAYARAKTAHDEKNKASNVLSGAVFSMFPTLDSFAHGVSKGDTLGHKVTSGAGRSISWAVALGACYYSLKSANDLVKSNPKIEKFTKKHPVLSQIAALTGVWAVVGGAFALTDKVKNKFLAKEGVNEVRASIEKLPHSAKINNALDKLKPLIGNKIAKNIVGIGLVSLVVKKLVDISTFNSKVDNNYKQLKRMQANISDDLDI